MPELVVPDALDGHALLDDNRLSLDREMVGRRVFTVDGPLAEALALGEQLSAESRAQPVLVNDIIAEAADSRTVDVYLHRDGRCISVSEGVERPQPT